MILLKTENMPQEKEEEVERSTRRSNGYIAHLLFPAVARSRCLWESIKLRMCNIIHFLVWPSILGNLLFRDFLSWMFNIDSHVLPIELSGVNSLNLFQYHSCHCSMAMSFIKSLYDAQ